jgi:hypothetical protein
LRRADVRYSLSEQVKTLWLLECREGIIGKLFTFYAENKRVAERHATDMLELHPYLVYVALSEKPEGFVFIRYRQPGKFEVPCKEE